MAVQLYHLGEVSVKVIILELFCFLTLQVLFVLIKSKPKIKGMTIFDYNHLYSAYTDDKIFVL